MSLKSNLNIAVFASGSGTNALNIAHTIKNDCSNINLKLILTDNPKAGVIEKAKFLGIPCLIVEKVRMTKEDYFDYLREKLEEFAIDWICLAGFMRLIPQSFINHFTDQTYKLSRIINVHPSLLPNYPGLYAFEKAFAAGDKVAGITIHLVDSGMDTGAIVEQETFLREETDSLDEFKNKGHALEYKLYSKVLKRLNSNPLSIFENIISKEKYDELSAY